MNDVPLIKTGDSISATQPEHWTASTRTRAVSVIANLLPAAIVSALLYLAYCAFTLFR
jgi:hypothetical protein